MNTANQISTISEFLLHAGTEYIVIDVSRGRQQIDNQAFFDIEHTKYPFPRPRQNCAWLCITFWNKQASNEHYLWYLKLPLDERGLLQVAARDQFLQILLEALGNQMQIDDSFDRGLPENPFVFEPSQQMRADCNAMLKSMLNLPLSEHAELATRYLISPEIIDWRGLSVQHLADAIANFDDAAIERIVVNQLNKYPTPVLTSFLSSIEGKALSRDSSVSLASFVNNNTDYLRALALRAMSHAEKDVCRELIKALLDMEKQLDIEILVVIAGRHWQHLHDEEILERYLERVLGVEEQDNLFNGIYADLVAIPELRASVLSLFGKKEISPMLHEQLQKIKARMHTK